MTKGEIVEEFVDNPILKNMQKTQYLVHILANLDMMELHHLKIVGIAILV